MVINNILSGNTVIYNNRTGWYDVINKHKLIKPIDEHMKSYDNGKLNFKSSLELNAIKYADYNKHIVKFALEPFAIKYIKPTDGKYHRYYIDLFLEFSNGEKFLVEVKSFGETIPPKKPKNKSQKSANNYQKALQTYYVNQAKWAAAKEFAKMNKLKFIILTERELK